jgi:hypothetical protein
MSAVTILSLSAINSFGVLARHAWGKRGVHRYLIPTNKFDNWIFIE